MKTRALAVALITLLASPAVAQTPKSEGSEVTLDNTESRLLTSEIVDQEFSIHVARPFESPRAPHKTYPVIYVLDSEIGFPLVRQVALSLRSGGELPPVLIVGIGYSGGFREGMVRRNRDYTPTADPVFMKFMGGSGPSGEADLFLAFIREELKPLIEADYPADPADATIFGSSFGGLFATYVLFHEPDTFQRYIIGSPSLWWGDRVVFEHEQRHADQYEDLSARVFVAAGGRETVAHDEAAFANMPEPMRRSVLDYREARGGSPQMVELIEPFVETLTKRSYPSLDLTLHIFPEETHSSVPPMIISRGLRVVFDTF